MNGEIPQAIKDKLSNLDSDEIDHVSKEIELGISWDEVEKIVDKAIAAKRKSQYCHNCDTRLITIKKESLCFTCYQFNRRTGLKWTNKIKTNYCIDGCARQVEYSYSTPAGNTIWLCGLHYKRSRSREGMSWLCSNKECDKLPRKGEIYCKDCLGKGRTS